MIDVDKDNSAVTKLAQDFQLWYIALPTIILIDGKGQVVKQYGGIVTQEVLAEEIEEIIKNK